MTDKDTARINAIVAAFNTWPIAVLLRKQQSKSLKNMVVADIMKSTSLVTPLEMGKHIGVSGSTMGYAYIRSQNAKADPANLYNKLYTHVTQQLQNAATPTT
jgi:hypothetical protein